VPDNQKNSGNHPGSLSKIRKIFGLNIGTMLFGCLLIYMLFSAVLYLTSTNIESIWSFQDLCQEMKLIQGLHFAKSLFTRQRPVDM